MLDWVADLVMPVITGSHWSSRISGLKVAVLWTKEWNRTITVGADRG